MKLTHDADWSYMDVDQSVYPFLFLFPLLPMPDELSGYSTVGSRHAAARTLWIQGASFRGGIMPHLRKLAAELRVAAIEPTGTAQIPAFCQMLAKIAHAFAVAEVGIEAFLPFLTPIICEGDTSNSVQYVGGLQFTEPARPVIHEMSFGTHTCERPDIVGVRIRLLAALETPTYFVAVGQRIRQRDVVVTDLFSTKVWRIAVSISAQQSFGPLMAHLALYDLLMDQKLTTS